MKKILLATCFALPFSILTIPKTKAQNIRHNAQVHEMIRILNGGHAHAPQTRRSISQRSVSINPTVQPRGMAHSHQQSGRYGYQGSAPSHDYSYQVDSSCHLCTNEIKFLKNSTQLADQCSYTYLTDLANALMDPRLCHQRFVIEGHASAEGSYSSNQLLSQRRANAIFDFLIRQGVPPTRLLAVGHGESQARYPSRSPEYLRSKDRRVMVYKLAY